MGKRDNNFKKKLAELKERLELEDISDDSYIIAALTHPSYRSIDNDAVTYDRLEFLGDAVIDLIMAEMLFKETDDKSGVMTEKRKLLVNNKHLSIVFDDLVPKGLIRTQNKYRPTVKDKADIVEALMGAVFLYKGYTFAYRVWEKIFKVEAVTRIKKAAGGKGKGKPPISYAKSGITIRPKNPKSSLQEFIQKLKWDIPEYSVVKTEGPAHKRIFTVRCTVKIEKNNKPITITAEGKAESKKMAEFNAARKICDKLGIPYIPPEKTGKK